MVLRTDWLGDEVASRMCSLQSIKLLLQMLHRFPKVNSEQGQLLFFFLLLRGGSAPGG